MFQKDLNSWQAKFVTNLEKTFRDTEKREKSKDRQY